MIALYVIGGILAAVGVCAIVVTWLIVRGFRDWK